MPITLKDLAPFMAPFPDYAAFANANARTLDVINDKNKNQITAQANAQQNQQAAAQLAETTREHDLANAQNQATLAETTRRDTATQQQSQAELAETQRQHSAAIQQTKDLATAQRRDKVAGLTQDALGLVGAGKDDEAHALIQTAGLYGGGLTENPGAPAAPAALPQQAPAPQAPSMGHVAEGPGAALQTPAQEANTAAPPPAPSPPPQPQMSMLPKPALPASAGQLFTPPPQPRMSMAPQQSAQALQPAAPAPSPAQQPPAPLLAPPPPASRQWTFTFDGKPFLTVDPAKMAAAHRAQTQAGVEAQAAAAGPEDQDYSRAMGMAAAQAYGADPGKVYEAQHRAVHERQELRRQEAQATATADLARSNADFTHGESAKHDDWHEDEVAYRKAQDEIRAKEAKEKEATRVAEHNAKTADERQRAREAGARAEATARRETAANTNAFMDKLAAGMGSEKVAASVAASDASLASLKANPGNAKVYMQTLYDIANQRERGVHTNQDIAAVPALVGWLDQAKDWAAKKFTGKISANEMNAMERAVGAFAKRNNGLAERQYMRFAEARDALDDPTAYKAADRWAAARYSGHSWWEEHRKREGLPPEAAQGGPEAPKETDAPAAAAAASTAAPSASPSEPVAAPASSEQPAARAPLEAKPLPTTAPPKKTVEAGKGLQKLWSGWIDDFVKQKGRKPSADEARAMYNEFHQQSGAP